MIRSIVYHRQSDCYAVHISQDHGRTWLDTGCAFSSYDRAEDYAARAYPRYQGPNR